MNTPTLWKLDATALTRGYADGRFKPSQALEAIHARIDEVNPAINAIIAENRAGAREAAIRSTLRWRERAPMSALDGVPFTVKDNIFAAALPATWGSAAYKSFQLDEDDPAIARLRAAGTIIIGKTNVPEFTVQGYTSNSLFGPTFNPLAPGRTPGGSTGGGAAAVAAGFGPLAIGTDGGGSVRRPAAHCGLFGLKPSIGQIARIGGFRQILADFEVIGPLARSLADLSAAFSTMRGSDPRDPLSQVASAPSRHFSLNLRAGYFAGIGAAPVDPEIIEASDRFATSLADKGFGVMPIDALFDLEHVNQVWGTIAAAGLAWEVGHLGAKANLIGDNARAMSDRGRACTLPEHKEALAEVGKMRAAAAELLERFDLLLCPSTAALACPANEPFPGEIDGKLVGPRGHAIFTAWMNVAGLCALNIPVASTADDGGIGMQLVAAPGRDLDLNEFLLASQARDEIAPRSSLDREHR
jgi:aspartyl-tRNA(Asn)/glutamyl-tRNA(Gln) amidotransferase subunit A